MPLIQNQNYLELKRKYYIIYFDISYHIQVTNTSVTFPPPQSYMSSYPFEKINFE